MKTTSVLVASRSETLSRQGPTFLLAPGEPWFARPNLQRPKSVWGAIVAMKKREPKKWRAMARDVFDLRRQKDADLLMPEGVLFQVVSVNRAEPGNPFRVWIDLAGAHKLRVWR